MRIDSHSNGYDISILQSLSGRNIITQSPPQAIQCETFSVECDRSGIEAFIAAMSPSFKSENVFFQNFIKTILQIHINRDTIPAVKSDYATATILQRQGTCQGKAFKRSLRSFCESKVEYQTLMAMIMYELITECKQLENLDVNHQLLINQSIKNLARLLKKVQPNSAIFPIPDLIPITITTKLKEPAETHTVEERITAEVFPELEQDYPLIGRETTYIPNYWSDRLREDKAYLFTIALLKNNIRINGQLPLLISRNQFLDNPIKNLAKLAHSSFIGCVFAHVELLRHINHYEVYIKERYTAENRRALLQFLYERYLDIVSQSSLYIPMQKWSQTVTSNDFRHGCIYDIWAHVKERTEKIHQSYNRIFQEEELMTALDMRERFFPNALHYDTCNVPESSPYYHLNLHPLTHTALHYKINGDSLNLTSKILRAIYNFIDRYIGSYSSLLENNIQIFSARNLNTAHSTKYEFHNREITRVQEVLFTGITMKEATLCNFDSLANPVIKQLLTLSSTLNPIIALESITSFVASQTINIFNSLKALHPVDHEQIDSLEYINHILKRSGALSTPQLHKMKSAEILLTQAIHHLRDNRFVEYALLIDTINTLLSSIISVEDLHPTDRFIGLARENAKILISISHSEETVINTLNNLQEKYPLNALKIFAMILSTNETLDERQQYTTIFSHQILLNQSVKSLVKRERFKNMVLQLRPFLRHSACDNTLFNKLSQSKNWTVAVCTVKTPALAILNLVNKEESRVSLVPSAHSSCAIERHYTQLGKNVFCEDPVSLIRQRLDLSINPRDLTLHEGSYHFTYQERNYRIDHNDNIYININDKELYLIATNKQWLIFGEGDSSKLHLVLHKLASPESILVSKFRRRYSYLEVMETSIPISCYSNSEHPTLAPLNQVIKVDDFELYPKYNLLLKHSQDRQEIVPACHPDVHLLNDNAHNSLYTFATLSQLGLYNHIVFLNRDSQAQKVCLLSAKNHAFFSIKSDYLIPSNNQDFLFLCKELLRANTKYLSAFLMMKALPYFSPREEDSKVVLESIISSVYDLKNYIHPYWFVFINRLLSTVPQYQLSASHKLRSILKQYQHIATNLNADDINFFHAFRFATPLASAQWFQTQTSTEYITLESLAQIAFSPNPSSRLLTLCPTSDAAVNAYEIYNKHGLHAQTFNSSTQAGYGGTKYPAYSLVKHSKVTHRVSLPRFISLGLCTSSMPITSLTGIVNLRPYEFFSEPFVKPITLTHSYTSSLQDNILKSIDASRDELESHGISQERFFTKLNENMAS